MAWLASIAAALILVTGFALWRLTQGPIDLDRLIPLLEQAINWPDTGLKVTISGARLGIDRQSRQLDVRLQGVVLADRGGEPTATFPDISASFSLGGLLQGKLMPTRLVVDRPVIRLMRDDTGAIRFIVGEPDTAARSLDPDVLDQLAGPPNADRRFGLMRRLLVRDATIIYEDRENRHRWQADRVDASIEREPEGFAGDVSLAFPIGSVPPELHIEYRYAWRERTLDVSARLSAVKPAILATLSPELAPLALADFPVSGTLATRLNMTDLRTGGVRADLYLGKGSIRNELLPEGYVSLENGTVRAAYAPESDELRLTKLDLDLGGGSGLTAKGAIDGLTPAMLIGAAALPRSIPGQLAINLVGVPVAKFQSLWPPALSPGGRRWALANIHDGAIDEAAVELDLSIDAAAASAEVTSAHGTMRYRDATITYLRGLAPVRKVSGTAILDNKRLVFTPAGGSVRSVQTTGGSLQITDLGAPVEWLTVDLSLAGPIQDFLETIDAKPLRYAHDIGVDPTHVGGRTEATLHFKLPLLRDLKLDQVQYAAKASLTGAAITHVAMNRNLTDGNFALEITRPGAHLWGSSRFAGVPLSLDANVFFKPEDGVRAQYRIGLTADDEQRHLLGLDLPPDRVAGPVGINLTYRVFDLTRAEAEAQLDLHPASLSVSEAGWAKPAGAPATGKLVLDLSNEKITRIRNIEIKAAGLDGRFAVALEPQSGGIERIDVRRLVIANDDIRGSLMRRRDAGWRIDLRGQVLDLSPWFKNSGQNRAEDPSAGPMQIDARLDRVILGAHRELRDVAARLFRDGAEWRAAQVEARFPDGHYLSLRSTPEQTATTLDFRSDDLGATLGLLDISNDVVGGQVRVTGRSAEEAGRAVVTGHIEGSDYSLVHAPPMARLLALPSFSGPSSMLAGSGIPFSTLRGDFVYQHDRLLFDRLLAYGGAIGITGNGVVDIGRDRLDMQGTIVPAYALNSMIGNVPLIGTLLLGGEGQGLFAANYRLTGSAADPQVSVNPLSALAPGFLRRLFQSNFGLPPTQQSLAPQ